MAGLADHQLAQGWVRGPCPVRRKPISATTVLNRQSVYVSARSSPTFLNSSSLEPLGKRGPRASTNAATFSAPKPSLPRKNHAFQSERRCWEEFHPFAAADSLNQAGGAAKVAMVEPPPSPALVGGLGGSRPDASRHGGQGRHLTWPHSLLHHRHESLILTKSSPGTLHQTPGSKLHSQQSTHPGRS
jgi:hypothetical protein